MIRKKLKMLVIFVSLVCATSAYAILPDPAELAQLAAILEQLRKEYTTLQNQLNALNDLKSGMQNQTNQLIGNYGMGNLLNSDTDLKARNWSPTDWESTLQMGSGGNAAKFEALMKSYEKYHPILDNNRLSKGVSAQNAQFYQTQTQTNRAAYATASYSYNEIQHNLQEIHTLSQKIDTTHNVKESLDLNARLIAQLGYLQVQILRLQTMQTQLQVQQNQGIASGMAQQAQFNQ